MTPEPVLFVLDHRGMGDIIIFIQVDTCYILQALIFFFQHVLKPKLTKLMKASQQSKRNRKLFEDWPPGIIP